jgi:predicted aconitase
MYYNKILTASTNKSKAPWKIVNNETGRAPKKKFIPPELRSGNKKIPISKTAEYLIHIS